ncbi:tRNA1(Val) (adenine(37)-N6)-methyltransferase [Hoeflea halophila]|uniref:tRNA1(Val) (adenine(37)-N6)-methyltransferase n=1 Tax=Hoeflea halophila TaxID=714899 RepID=UPI001FCE8D4B|nr:methyltransferase [Hoeflea halophila]
MTQAPDSKTADARPATTIDAFHNGGFFLVQPADSGHRAGMDAMLLAATVPEGAGGVLADLGAGAGAAGLAALNRLPDLSAVLIERSTAMADCARRSLALRENAHLASRTRILEADVTLTGNRRRDAGLADYAYDYVILNPPFNAGNDRRTPDPLKAEAHAMETDDMFERWLRTAAAILKPGGQVSVIARPESLAEIFAALGKRFGGIEITPVIPRAGSDAIRVLVTAIKGSQARMGLRDGLFIHEGQGREFSARMSDLANGRSALPRRTKNRSPK